MPWTTPCANGLYDPLKVMIGGWFIIVLTTTGPFRKWDNSQIIASRLVPRSAGWSSKKVVGRSCDLRDILYLVVGEILLIGVLVRGNLVAKMFQSLFSTILYIHTYIYNYIYIFIHSSEKRNIDSRMSGACLNSMFMICNWTVAVFLMLVTTMFLPRHHSEIGLETSLVQLHFFGKYIYICISGWWFGTFFIFPYIGNNHPNWLSYFSEGFKPPTRYLWYLYTYIHIYIYTHTHLYIYTSNHLVIPY